MFRLYIDLYISWPLHELLIQLFLSIHTCHWTMIFMFHHLSNLTTIWSYWVHLTLVQSCYTFSFSFPFFLIVWMLLFAMPDFQKRFFWSLLTCPSFFICVTIIVALKYYIWSVPSILLKMFQVFTLILRATL